MNVVQQIIESPIAERVGWCLIHSSWQFAVVALVIAGILALIPTRQANLRYLSSLLGLALCALIACFTFMSVSISVQPPQSETAEASHEVRVAPRTSMQPAKPKVGAPKEASDSSAAMDASPILLTDESDLGSSRGRQLPIVGWNSSLLTAYPDWFKRGLPWVAWIWLVGVALFSIRPALGISTSLKMRRVGRSEVPQYLARTLSVLIEKLKVTRAVELSVSTLVEVPTVVGFIRPAILVPASSLTSLTAKELEAILLHELAHILRYDDVMNLAQTVLETIMFYHPAIWWMSRQARIERENCCDDLAVEVCGESKSLVRALLTLEEGRDSEPLLAATGGSLVKRIKRQLQLPLTDESRRNMSWLSGVLVFVVVATIGGAIWNNHLRAGESSATFGRHDDHFSQLQVVSLNDLYAWQSRNTEDPQLIHKFWNMFPQHQRDGAGESLADWEPDLEFRFRRVVDGKSDTSITTIKVGLQDGFRWSAGRGVWLLPGQWPMRYALSEFQAATQDTAQLIKFDSLDSLGRGDSEITSIRYLGQGVDAINDSGLQTIAERFPKLRQLKISEAREITDAGMEYLAKLGELRQVQIRFAEKLTEKSASILSQLKKLRSIDLSYSRGLTTDLAMVDFAQLPELRNLILARHAGGGITNVGQKILKKHPSLKRVLVTGQHPFTEALARNLTSPISPIVETPYADSANERFIVVADQPVTDLWSWVMDIQREEDRIQRLAGQLQREEVANLATLRQNKQMLIDNYHGQWVAIVDGKLIAPLPSFDEAVAAADRINRYAAHRFIFRPGIDDNNASFAHSPWITGQPGWWQLGRQFQRDHLMTIGPSVWAAGGKRVNAPGGKSTIELSSPGGPPLPPRFGAEPLTALRKSAGCSGMVQQQLTLTEQDVLRLGLARFAVPGQVTSETYKVVCAKVHVQVAIDGLGINQRVVAFVMPQSIVDLDPAPAQNNYPPLLVSEQPKSRSSLTDPGADDADPSGRRSDEIRVRQLDADLRGLRSKLAKRRAEQTWIAEALMDNNKNAEVILWLLKQEGKIQPVEFQITNQMHQQIRLKIESLEIQLLEQSTKLGPRHPTNWALQQRIDHWKEYLNKDISELTERTQVIFKPIDTVKIYKQEIDREVESLDQQVKHLEKQYKSLYEKLNPDDKTPGINDLESEGGELQPTALKSTVQIEVLGDDSLLLKGQPDDVAAVARTLSGTRTGQVIEMMANSANAGKQPRQDPSNPGKPAKSGSVKIDIVGDRLITLTGSPDEVAVVRQLIQSLTVGNHDSEPTQKPGSTAEPERQGKINAEKSTWIAKGTVTDQKGTPIPGVKVRANTGVGSLRRSGEAVTNKHGKYELQFHPGAMFSGGDDQVGVQAATIFVSKLGLAEKSMCRAGDRLMAAKMPTEQTAWGTLDQIKDKLILQGRPVTIDFVMVPAASIEGFLVDSDGNLLQKRSVSLTGPELPPSSSVLDQVYADDGGHFTIPDVPLNRTWKFEFRIPNSFVELHSEDFQLKQPAPQKILLVVDFESDPPTLTHRPMTAEDEARLSGRSMEMKQQPTIRGSRPSPDEEGNLVWGKQTNGLQAAVRIGTDKPMVIGDQQNIEYFVRNVSDKIIKFESSSWRQEDTLKIRKVDGRAQDVSRTWYSGQAAIKTYELHPGEVISIASAKIALLDPALPESRAGQPAAYHLHLKPGKYISYFRLRFPDVRRFPQDEGNNWEGTLYTGETEFEVKPRS